MIFTERWRQIYKKSKGYATIDNDVHNNGGSIIPFNGEYLTSVWVAIDGGITLQASTNTPSPKTLDEAKEMAEKLFNMLVGG